MQSQLDTARAVIAARAVMGVGAAMIMPATLSLLVAAFPRGERARAITAWSATSGLGIAAGPVLAGLLLRHFAWGSTFLINVPIAVVAIVVAETLGQLAPLELRDASHAELEPAVEPAGA